MTDAHTDTDTALAREIIATCRLTGRVVLCSGGSVDGCQDRARELWNWIQRLILAIAIWLVAFPVRETIFPRRPRR